MAKKKKQKSSSNTLAINKIAKRNYEIETTYEAGIVLTGAEVKSIKGGGANLKEAYVKIIKGEVFLLGCHISKYSNDNDQNYDPEKDRKLLLNKKEINRIALKIKQGGLSLIPTKMYISRNKIKMEVGLGKGKKLFDKRSDIKDKEQKRKLERYNKAYG